jgi:hypothetical protein
MNEVMPVIRQAACDYGHTEPVTAVTKERYLAK